MTIRQEGWIILAETAVSPIVIVANNEITMIVSSLVDWIENDLAEEPSYMAKQIALLLTEGVLKKD
jgi:hypothetical protein